MGSNRPVLCILGATASGKSALAEMLAQHYDGEIISADSMQVYRGMDIGTAKQQPEQRSVPYHCIDIVNPDEPYSAALFQRDSRRAIEDIWARGKVPVICGGTFFYVRACLDQMDFAAGEQQDNPVRQKYAEMLEQIGAEALHVHLAELDPSSAAVIHPNNSVRVIRALEMFEEGESYASRKAAFKTIPEAIPACKICLDWGPEDLYPRINQRVDTMFEMGLVEEVRQLLENGFREGLTAPAAIGYKEVVDALDNKITMEEAAEQIKQSTRRYSKRQRTWLRSERNVHHIDAAGLTSEQLLEKAVALYDAYPNGNIPIG